jgi:hypothetical protein
MVFPILENNEDKVAVISYQVSWPGYDPMYEHNPGPVNARVAYYGVRGVPNTVMDGFGPGGSLDIVSQANINVAANKVAPFDLDLQVDPTIGFDGLTIELGVTANRSVSGNLVAHVVIVEEGVHFNSPPGTNGEKDFHFVMKEMLPTSRGTSLDSDWTAGKSTSISFDYNFENFYNWQEAAVVVFIQNDTNKEVLQAAYWSPSFEPNPGDDVLIQAASTAGNFDAEVDVVCGGQANPVIRVMNSGVNPLTSFDVSYNVNGSANSNYTWTGNLGTFEVTEVELPEITFPIQIVGEMNVDVNMPNGNQDNYPDNGKIFTEFLIAPNTTSKSTFEIKPVIRPADLSFKIYDAAGNVILEDGPLSSRTAQRYDLTLNDNECYRIAVDNKYPSINGTYKLLDENGDVLINEIVQGVSIFESDFGTFTSVSTQDFTEVSEWTITPNPAFNNTSLNILVADALNLDIIFTDLIGKVVYQQNLRAHEGMNKVNMDLSSLERGIYLVSLMSGDKVSTKKLVVR